MKLRALVFAAVIVLLATSGCSPSVKTGTPTTPATVTPVVSTGSPVIDIPEEYYKTPVKLERNGILFYKDIVRQVEDDRVTGVAHYSMNVPTTETEAYFIMGVDGNRHVYLVKNDTTERSGVKSVEVGYYDLIGNEYHAIKSNDQNGINFCTYTDEYAVWAECDRSDPQWNPVVHVYEVATGKIQAFTLPNVENRDFSIYAIGGQYEIVGDHLYYVVVETLDKFDKADQTSLYDFNISTGETTRLGLYGLYPHDNLGTLNFFKGASIYSQNGELIADSVKRDTNNFAVSNGVYAWNEQLLDPNGDGRSIPEQLQPYIEDAFLRGSGLQFHQGNRTEPIAMSVNDAWIGGPCTNGEVIALTSGSNPPMVYDIERDIIVEIDADVMLDYNPYATDHDVAFIDDTTKIGGPMTAEVVYVDLAED